LGGQRERFQDLSARRILGLSDSAQVAQAEIARDRGGI
jgi:hypothetical protein